MRAIELFDDLQIAGHPTPEIEISGVQHDSRRVTAGDLFVALVGERFDGRVFVGEAVQNGAVAALGSGPAPAGLQIPWFESAQPRAILGPLSARVHGHPDREMLTVGITGTNGKSTVVALVAAALEAAGHSCGRLGTLGYRFKDHVFPGERTTPEASDLFSTLRAIRDRGGDSVVMEVSSHALALDRVEGMGFDVAVFTNLTRDHFDFHPDYEDYFQAKRRLFSQLDEGGRAVLNLDDPYGRRLADEIPGALTYGASAEVRCESSRLDRDGIEAEFVTPRGPVRITSALLGRYNVENLTTALAVCEALELDHESAAAALGSVGPIPGRMELLDLGQDVPILIDYAHTDAALQAVLEAARELYGPRVVAVFGCGGDRDPGKRVLMGRVAGQLAAIPILTSDNPRREDPLAIIAAVEEGLRQANNEDYLVEPDRRSALRRAMSLASTADVIVIAGKGHEEVQIVGDRELPFSDATEIKAALEDGIGQAQNG